MTKRSDSTHFQTSEESRNFYDCRYTEGYMTDWDIQKKRKVMEVIKQLNLPAKGRLLDFGCGNGVITNILAEALPEWEVYGTDLSHTAINNATELFPRCSFVTDTELNQIPKFDLIFTHHVLEHVIDLEETIDQLGTYLLPNGKMFHILPCGNANSFEHKMCSLIKGGIQHHANNRFFFEEEGHLRRLSSADLSKLLEKKGMTCEKAYFSNHFREAIDRITSSNPKLLIMLTAPLKGKSIAASLKLLMWRLILTPLLFLRLPIQIVTKISQKKGGIKPPLKALYYMCIPYHFIFSPIDHLFKQWCAKEWDSKKEQPNGSEMLLYFVKK